MKNDWQIMKLYEEVEELRKKVKNNKDAYKYYKYLVKLNENDRLYGWMFVNDRILTDDAEILDCYQNAYVRNLLQCYKNELENILLKVDL